MEASFCLLLLSASEEEGAASTAGLLDDDAGEGAMDVVAVPVGCLVVFELNPV